MLVRADRRTTIPLPLVHVLVIPSSDGTPYMPSVECISSYLCQGSSTASYKIYESRLHTFVVCNGI